MCQTTKNWIEYGFLFIQRNKRSYQAMEGSCHRRFTSHPIASSGGSKLPKSLFCVKIELNKNFFQILKQQAIQNHKPSEPLIIPKSIRRLPSYMNASRLLYITNWLLQLLVILIYLSGTFTIDYRKRNRKYWILRIIFSSQHC